MANDNEYSDKVWFMARPVIIWRYCVFILSPNMISSPHRGKWLHVSNLLPAVHCMSSCYVARLFVRRLFFLSFTLFD